LADALSRTAMALCGGLRQWETMVRGTPESVRAEALRAFAATQGRRFILGTGCVTPIIAPTCNLVATRHVVDGLRVA
jgi:uroporphyrinogen decarboxylase